MGDTTIIIEEMTATRHGFRTGDKVVAVIVDSPLRKYAQYTVSGAAEDGIGNVSLVETPRFSWNPSRFRKTTLPAAGYDIVYADPPWPMYGDPNKNAAAGKHYSLMMMDDICEMPMRSLLRDPKSGVFFIWATSPRMDLAIDAIRAWGLHYRGIAFVWVKTRKDGGIIHGQGVRPTVTKPTTELCLVATTCKRGRPFPLLSEKTPQVVLHPRGRHSEKPDVFRQHIVDLYGDRPRIELFARTKTPGWDVWGNEAP